MALDRARAEALSNPDTHTAPTIVALWSSECTHCKKNLLLFGRMARDLPGLRLVTVATEPLSNAQAGPLDQFGVTGPRYAYGPEMPEALAHALDPQWYGELPRTLFFDGRSGRIAVSGVVDEAYTLQALGISVTRGSTP